MDLNARLNTVRLFVFDVDGVLTDGRIVLDNLGNELKFFDVRDGAGLALLKRAGVATGLLTGRTSQVVARRAQELDVDYVVQGSADKAAGLAALCAQAAVSPDQVAYMGDDFIDLPVMLRVGFAAAPADAHDEVRKRAHYVTQAKGGRGAAREAAELLLRARGQWELLMQELTRV